MLLFFDRSPVETVCSLILGTKYVWMEQVIQMWFAEKRKLKVRLECQCVRKNNAYPTKLKVRNFKSNFFQCSCTAAVSGRCQYRSQNNCRFILTVALIYCIHRPRTISNDELRKITGNRLSISSVRGKNGVGSNIPSVRMNNVS